MFGPQKISKVNEDLNNLIISYSQQIYIYTNNMNVLIHIEHTWNLTKLSKSQWYPKGTLNKVLKKKKITRCFMIKCTRCQ